MLPRLQIGELDAACLNSGSAVAHCAWQRDASRVPTLYIFILVAQVFFL
jgi:hypothetical protein